jgi:hypothetical protein
MDAHLYFIQLLVNLQTWAADRRHGKSQYLRRSVLLLPASAERSVELHKTLVLRAARLREREFSGKERPLAVQDFEIGRGTPLVPHVG